MLHFLTYEFRSWYEFTNTSLSMMKLEYYPECNANFHHTSKLLKGNLLMNRLKLKNPVPGGHGHGPGPGERSDSRGGGRDAGPLQEKPECASMRWA